MVDMLDDGLFVGGKPGALVEQGADLALELTDGPTAFEAFVFVEGPLPRVVDTKQFNQMGPREFQDLVCDQRARMAWQGSRLGRPAGFGNR